LIKKLKSFIQNTIFINAIIVFTKRLRLPGFDNIPLYDVGQFFYKRINEGELQTRARSMAFSFLLALFPTIIFIFTLIPYIPIPDFQEKLLSLIQTLLPGDTYKAAKFTIEDIVKHQRGGLLSFGFFFALFVSADGVLAVMRWFNRSFHGKEERKPWKLRLMAIGLTITLAVFVILAITLLISSEIIYNYLSSKEMILDHLTHLLILQIGKWVILLALCFSAISLLYYFGPSDEKKLRFISAGSSLATLLIVATSLGFNFFITHFGQYNKVYGSIGTLIIILIWLYINSLVLLIGYELNVAIKRAKEGEITPLPIR